MEVEQGIMIETPAAVIISDELAERLISSVSERMI